MWHGRQVEILSDHVVVVWLGYRQFHLTVPDDVRRKCIVSSAH